MRVPVEACAVRPVIIELCVIVYVKCKKEKLPTEIPARPMVLIVACVTEYRKLFLELVAGPGKMIDLIGRKHKANII